MNEVRSKQQTARSLSSNEGLPGHDSVRCNPPNVGWVALAFGTLVTTFHGALQDKDLFPNSLEPNSAR